MHAANKICGVGEWIEAVGGAKIDTTCRPCSAGRFRSTPPERKEEEEEKSVCKPHKTCKAGEWTEAEGDAKTDTKCKSCSAGSFRSTAPKSKTKEDEKSVCIVHKTCKAGEWTEAVGTPVKDTTCVKCPAGTARAKAPTNSTSVETASSCTPCAANSAYSDEAGLAECKTCPNGRFGVVAAGSKGEGGHKACEADTCERPTSLPANSVVVSDKCPEHGKQKEMLGTATVKAASTCTLSCKVGFYSSAASTPFTCLPDGKSTTASYQGGAITCTGGLRWCVVKMSPVRGDNIPMHRCSHTPIYTHTFLHGSCY